MVVQMDPKKIKGKEFFTIELDLENNNVTFMLMEN